MDQPGGYRPPEFISAEILRHHGFDAAFREAFRDDYDDQEVHLNSRIVAEMCKYPDTTNHIWVWDHRTVESLAEMLLGRESLEKFETFRDDLMRQCDQSWRQYQAETRRKLDPLKWKLFGLLMLSMLVVSGAAIGLFPPSANYSLSIQFLVFIVTVAVIIAVVRLVFELPISKRVSQLETELGNDKYLELAEFHRERLKQALVDLWVEMQGAQVRV